MFKWIEAQKAGGFLMFLAVVVSLGFLDRALDREGYFERADDREVEYGAGGAAYR